MQKANVCTPKQPIVPILLYLLRETTDNRETHYVLAVPGHADSVKHGADVCEEQLEGGEAQSVLV